MRSQSMKNHFLFLLFSVMTLHLSAQAPEAFNYQAVARDNSGNPLVSRSITVKISILSGSTSGTTVYSETHNVTTNQFGLFNLSIGTGTVVSGTFSNINWGSNSFYTKVEVDPNGGNSFQLLGTSQLLSVPYALYAKNAGSTQYQTLSIRNDTIFLSNGGFVKISSGLNSGNKPIVSTQNPGNITSNSAVVYGNVTDDGGELLLSKGLLFGTTPNLSTINQLWRTTPSASDYLGVFSLNATNLNPNTTYYVKAFATNSNGTTYGNQVSFSTPNVCFQQEDKLGGYYRGSISYVNGGNIDSISWNYYYDTIGIENNIFSDCKLEKFTGGTPFNFYSTNLNLPSGTSSFSINNISSGNVYLWSGYPNVSYESYVENTIYNITCQSIPPSQLSVTYTIVSGTFKTTNPYYITKGYNNRNCAGAKFTGIYNKIQ